jgi:hypothetical protein
MNDDAYRRRLERDLDKWTQAGWIAPDGGPRILASLPPPNPGLSASTALGFAGAGLLGVAAIAFVMANWDGLPRFGRLGLIVALIAATMGGASTMTGWYSARRPSVNFFKLSIIPVSIPEPTSLTVVGRATRLTLLLGATVACNTSPVSRKALPAGPPYGKRPPIVSPTLSYRAAGLVVERPCPILATSAVVGNKVLPPVKEA